MALAGSRWLVMKNSMQSPTLEMRGRRRGRVSVVSRGEMGGRWEMESKRKGGGLRWGC